MLTLRSLLVRRCQAAVAKPQHTLLVCQQVEHTQKKNLRSQYKHRKKKFIPHELPNVTFLKQTILLHTVPNTAGIVYSPPLSSSWRLGLTFSLGRRYFCGCWNKQWFFTKPFLPDFLPFDVRWQASPFSSLFAELSVIFADRLWLEISRFEVAQLV